ncbi:hypothetical protein B0H17DRAFT_1087583 [Mycena rosella]|uniref:Uncharacterized protein n=1 Tax=Mycena rosella TaxID=1033263 RepID=A0AAD7G928_MYCRO|nr:hypothetical protein B0H17DRAFT_1087583 [Mycena rosella]
MDQRRQPVFLIEVKDDSPLTAPSKRAAADQQMRARYDGLLYNCPLPLLYGLSVMGTNMRVYIGDAVTMTLNPPRVETSPNCVLDRKYLEDAWNVDILSALGFVKMKEIVNFIKTTPPVNVNLINSFLTACHSRQRSPGWGVDGAFVVALWTR